MKYWVITYRINLVDNWESWTDEISYPFDSFHEAFTFMVEYNADIERLSDQRVAEKPVKT